MKSLNNLKLKISNNDYIDLDTFLTLLEEYLADEFLFEKIVERILIKNKCDKALTNKLLNLSKCEDLKYLINSIRKFNL